MMMVGLVLPFIPEAALKNRFRYRECLALGYLTAALEQDGYRVLSLNCELLNLSPENAAEQLLSNDAMGLVGISISSQRGYFAAKKLAALLKARRPDLHVTCGGILPTTWHQTILGDCDHIDSVVRGEGEEAVVRLASAVATQSGFEAIDGLTFRRGVEVVQNRPTHRRMDLTALPMPARRDLDAIRASGKIVSSAYMVASRGCYAKCSFCSIHQIYGDHRVAWRSPESIVNEMKALIDRYDVRHFSFVDDLFLMPSRAGLRWAAEFCDELQRARLGINFYAEIRADTVEPSIMKRLIDAGMDRVFIGFESGVNSVLTRMDKGTTVEDNDRALSVLRGLGLSSDSIRCGYIMFEPEMSFEELKQQYWWIRQSGICRVQHLQNRMNVYWGTPLFEKMRRDGRAKDAPFAERWFYSFDDVRVEQVERYIRKFLKRFEDRVRDSLFEVKSLSRNRLLEEDTSAISPCILEVFEQGLRRLEHIERECWYMAFDHFFCAIENSGRITDEDETELWESLAFTIDGLERECAAYRIFCETIHEITIALDPRAVADIPTARETVGPTRRAEVRLSLGPELVHYEAELGIDTGDCYGHRCSLTWIQAGQGAA